MAIQHRRRAVILVAVLALIIAAAATDASHHAIQALLDSVRAVIVQHPVTGMLLFVLLAALSGMLVFFSSAIIIPAAVYAWGKGLTFALLFAGWMIGGIASYLLGRYPARRLFQRMIPAREIRHYERAISNETPFFVILLFQIALQSEIPGYVLGAARYDFRKYLAALALTQLPYAAGAIYLSESFIGRKYLLLTALGAATILISIAAFHLFRKHVASRRDS